MKKLIFAALFASVAAAPVLAQGAPKSNAAPAKEAVGMPQASAGKVTQAAVDERRATRKALIKVMTDAEACDKRAKSLTDHEACLTAERTSLRDAVRAARAAQGGANAPKR